MDYDLEEHKHRFAVWAASRAASVNTCRFPVSKGKVILENSGFNTNFSNPDHLPAKDKIDEVHKNWRRSVIDEASKLGLNFTDGLAAKLINCYLKARFVCAGFDQHENVKSLHPPIDAILMASLVKLSPEWKILQKRRWSKFTSDDYEEAIALIRRQVGFEPMWMIEKHWSGFQG